MILVVDAQNHDQFSDVLDEVFHLQTRLFGPDAKVRFCGPSARGAGPSDAQSQTYLVGLDQGGRVVSFAKFPQTAQTLPPMGGTASPPFFAAGTAQAVQLCLDVQHFGPRASARLKATVMLMIAVLEYAQTAGIVAITMVTDPYISRILRQSSDAPHGQMGRVAAIAAVLDCSVDRIGALRDYAGIGGDVFVSAGAAQALRAVVSAKPTSDPFAIAQLQSEIALYCAQQLATASTEKERAAAHRLLCHLVEKGLHPVP